MDLNWREEIIEAEIFYRVIKQGNQEIANVDCLSRVFVDALIIAHNEAVSEAYRTGLKDGVEMAKETYKIIKGLG